jgi:hypothetical protein
MFLAIIVCSQKQFHNLNNRKGLISMLWYEPYSSPAEWATNKANNFDNLINNWKLCKYNPGVLRAFLAKASYKDFCKLLCLYKSQMASQAQIDDLINIASENLKKWVDIHIDWGYNKSINTLENTDEECDKLMTVLLEFNILYKSELIYTIVSNYTNADDTLRYVFALAFVELFSLMRGPSNAEAFVDFDHVENAVYNACKSYAKNIRFDSNTINDSDKTMFENFVMDELLHTDKYSYDAINDLIGKVCIECECRINCDDVCKVFPSVHSDDVNAVYNALRNALTNIDNPSNFTLGCLMSDIHNCKCNKEDLCKVTKLCINNLNYFNPECISKSCEDAVLSAIHDYDEYSYMAIEDVSDVNMDYELTCLENMTVNEFIATEANRYDDFDDDEEESPKRKSPEPERDPHISEEGYDIAKKARNFDQEYRRFKNNVSAVDGSLTKIISDIGKAFTGMSESRGVRKVTKQDSLAKVLARVFGTIAIFHVSKFMGLLFVIVRLANSKKVTERERVKLISEIQREIEIIDSQLNDGSIESTEAKRNLQRTRSALEEALRKIQSNKGKYMTDEAKNAVNDIVSRRR